MYLKNKVIGIVARAELWSKKIVDFSMRLFDMALRRDNDFGGYINGADGTGDPDRTPRYGPSRLESLANILSFATRHMGKTHEEYKGPVDIWGIGIGGQAACAYQKAGIRNPHPNRRLMAMDTLGIDFASIIIDTVKQLRNNTEGYESLSHDQKIKMLLAHEEVAKIFIVAGSKSGTTDEAMTNFQLAMQTLIEIYFRFSYDDEIGETKATEMIAKLYDGKDWFDPANNILDKLTQEETSIFKIALDHTIVATGDWKGAWNENGGGSRFDRLSKYLAERGLTLTKSQMTSNLGGRNQGASPNADMYETLLGYDVAGQIDAGKAEGTKQLTERQRNEDAQIARMLKEKGIDRLIAAGANKSIYGGLLEAIDQFVSESLGKGKVVGNPVGLRAHSYTFQDALTALNEVEDEDGSRAYFLIKDPLLSEDDKAAITRIKEEQEAKGNIVVEFELDGQDEVSYVKLLQRLEHIVSIYGLLTTSEVLLTAQNLEIPADIRETLSLGDVNTPAIAFDENKHDLQRIITGKPLDDGVELSDEEKLLSYLWMLYCPQRQPDVEAAKKLLKGQRSDFSDGIGFNMYNTSGAKDDDKGLPIRDQKEREKSYTENQEVVAAGPAFESGSIHLLNQNDQYQETALDTSNIVIPHIDRAVNSDTISSKITLAKILMSTESQYDPDKTEQSTEEYRALSDAAHKELRVQLAELAQLAQADSRYDKTAKELAKLMHHARSQGKTVNITIYDEVGQNLKLLQRFATFLGIEDVKFGSKEQHITKQFAVGGKDLGLEIIVKPAKSLDDVAKRERRPIVFDGMVPKYLHGLFGYEENIAFAEAYAQTFQDRKVETAILNTKDLLTDDGLTEMLTVFARATLIYQEDFAQQEEPVEIGG